jgi:ribonuclease PH
VGVVAGVPLLDLNYAEDSSADVDFNLVMTERGEFVEIQGTAEREPFGGPVLEDLLRLGRQGIAELIDIQRATLVR